MPMPGFITASMFNAVMTQKIGKVVLKQCCRIACERLGVSGLEEQYDISGLRMIEWGNEMEPLAIRAYEAETFTSIHSRQTFHRLPDMLVGGTPDGLVDTDGIIEVKCPNSDNHLLNMTQGAQVSDYYNQFQAYLWITDRWWCDFISFDPRFPDDLRMHVQRIERDDKVITALHNRAVEMEDIISDLVEKARPGFKFNGLSKGDLTDLLYRGQ